MVSCDSLTRVVHQKLAFRLPQHFPGLGPEHQMSIVPQCQVRCLFRLFHRPRRVFHRPVKRVRYQVAIALQGTG